MTSMKHGSALRGWEPQSKRSPIVTTARANRRLSFGTPMGITLQSTNRGAPPNPQLQRTVIRHRVRAASSTVRSRSEEHTSELQSQSNLVCRLLLEKKKIKQ